MIIDIHGHLGNINFSEFWQADADRLEQDAAEAEKQETNGEEHG